MAKKYIDHIEGIDVEVYEYDSYVDTVEDASRLSGEPIDRIAKTLILKSDDECIVAIVRGDNRIDMDGLSRYLGKKIRLARPREVKEITGVEIGGVTPISNKIKICRIFMDSAILNHEYIICGGGSRKRLYKVYVADLIDYLDPIIIDSDIFKPSTK